MQLVHSGLEVPEHPQLRCTSNLDPHKWLVIRFRLITFTRRRRLPHEEAVQARGVHHGELDRHGEPEEHAAEALAAEADVLGHAVAYDEREGLEHGAGGEHVFEVAVAEDGVEDAELSEVGEDAGAVGVREPPEAEVEAAERGAAEDVSGEAQIDGRGLVDEDEVLDAAGGKEARPPGELALVELEEAVGEVYGVEGARVVDEDAGDGGDALWVAGGEEVGVAEDKWGGVPDAAPAGGERGGEEGVLDGEAGDDAAEDLVGEGADAVLAVVIGGGVVGGEGGGPVGGRGGEASQDAVDDRVHGGRGRVGAETGATRRKCFGWSGGDGGSLLGIWWGAAVESTREEGRLTFAVAQATLLSAGPLTSPESSPELPSAVGGVQR